MKKFSIIILILLPFFLIYFVSLAGKIYSTYTSTNLETLVIKDKNHTFEEGEILELRVGIEEESSHYIMLEFNPENASNKTYSIAKYDESVIKFTRGNKDDGIIEAVGEGVTHLIFTSLWNSSITTELTVRVFDDQLRDFNLQSKELSVKVGGKADIKPTYVPYNPVEEQKGFIYTSQNPSIATVNQYGTVTGVSIGETYIVVKSKYLGEEKLVKVTVTEHGAGEAYFTLENSKGVDYVAWSEKQIDLFDWIAIEGAATKKDFKFHVEEYTGSINTTNLQNDGILIFNEKGSFVTVGLYRKSVSIENRIDTISIRYFG